MDKSGALKFIEDKLVALLPHDLYYHGFHHVKDVANAARVLAKEENLTDRHALELLETAAFYHDTGFLHTYSGHEEQGCVIAETVLPFFDYSPEDIQVICGMIMATRIPQSPTTLLEKILCDADLDYLGRADFEPIASSLYAEMAARSMVTDKKDWNQIQINFLNQHHYWTQSAHNLRDSGKQFQLRKLIRLAESFKD
ncbi:hypothetical protein DYBT9275_01876 [Dyadobacter sp. CECT 9275]|uniref:HD/PDEase domain-containing protein n=1 Tax=Dyadobacter helix TaxID=2822344 RepID=A0A916N3V0_9BACT|nr:HD domain-containing protein [Dyadobacter sp. CECT 9275]CAG4997897.1 hypothetical protein DYBT9275_01876 [Dyadobacter sp. CECT 9275]